MLTQGTTEPLPTSKWTLFQRPGSKREEGRGGGGGESHGAAGAPRISPPPYRRGAGGAMLQARGAAALPARAMRASCETPTESNSLASL